MFINNTNLIHTSTLQAEEQRFYFKSNSKAFNSELASHFQPKTVPSTGLRGILRVRKFNKLELLMNKDQEILQNLP